MLQPAWVLPRRRFARPQSTWLPGRGKKDQDEETSSKDDVRGLLASLKTCSNTRNLECGKRIHAKLMEIGHDSSTHVALALVKMYAKCGKMAEAHRVFDHIRQPSVTLWTALMLGYAENGDGLISLDLFSRMKSQGYAPESVTYVAALKACTSLALEQDGLGRAEYLQQGKQIHSEIGCFSSLYLQTTLVDMYAKCGSMVEAHNLFDHIKRPSVVSWNTLLLGYAENGDGLSTLDLFSRMKCQGCAPDSVTYVAALKACASLGLKQRGSGRAQWLDRGKQIHSEIGRHSSPYVENVLIDMYTKCGSMVDAHQVFDSIKHPSVVSWTALLLGYADSGEGLIALDLFSRMKSQGCAPNPRTYVAAIKACASLAPSLGRAECLERGKQIHLEIGVNHLNRYVQTTLIDMYAKCGSMIHAHQVFDGIRQPDVVSWNALLLGYTDNGDGLVVLDLLSRMKAQGCAANCVTYLAALKTCGLLGALDFGRKIHAEVSEFDAVVVTCLVDFYAKCGSMVEAQEVFDLHSEARDLTTWTALLSGYSSFGETKPVFRLFEEMQDAGFQPDDITLQCVLLCCSHAGLVEKARECFQAMSAKYAVAPGVEHYTCMIDVLGRANKLDDAIVLLLRMSCCPDVLTWMAVLGACRKWRNAEVGRLAFQSLVSLDDSKAAAYIQMAQIYTSKEDQEMVLTMRKASQGWEELEQSCWTDEMGKVHKLRVGDNDHPQIQEMWEKLKQMDQVMKVYHVEKEKVLCGQTEKLAIACALINTKPGETIRIVKNLRVCDGCHKMIALISKLEQRTIFFKDAGRLHVFKDCKCSCGDCW